MTVSDMLAPPVPEVAEAEGGGARARVRATPSVTDSEPTVIRRAVGKVTDDFRDAWLWDAHGLTVRSLWDARVPDRDAVPAANRALWFAWSAYNHAALTVLVPLMFAVWVLGHPARLIYAAPMAAPLTLLWLT